MGGSLGKGHGPGVRSMGSSAGPSLEVLALARCRPLQQGEGITSTRCIIRHSMPFIIHRHPFYLTYLILLDIQTSLSTV